MLKILIVDDETDLEPLILQKFRQRIREGELHFEFALNGEQALEKLAQDGDLDIVFSDINMPVMDGLTLLSRIGPLNRNLKTIIVSAYDDMQNIRTAMNRGAYDFLTKPIDFQDFEQTLSKTAKELDLLRESVKHRQELLAIQSELSVASRIQQIMLPGTFPVDSRFEIYASMLPARVVSGDFYDFFPLDDHRLAFAIGDVSGKGIPAAIFMAVSRTLLHGTAPRSATPAECLQTMNQILLRQGKGEMFVTLFYGVLDLETGRVDFCTAGQNSPALVKDNGFAAVLTDARGNMLGLFSDVELGAASITLEPGDCLVLFTDGVPDAENSNGISFTDVALLSALQGPARSAREMVAKLMAAVRDHVEQADRCDDVTVLALRFKPAANLQSGV